MDVKQRLLAVAGGFGYLTHAPIGRSEAAWDAFRREPVSIVVVGYAVGLILAGIITLPIPATMMGFVFPLTIVVLIGISHLDGVADCGDAVVAHGETEKKRDILKDTATGVGGIVAVGLVILGLGTAGVALTEIKTQTAIWIVLTAEVGAKLSMAILACIGSSAHEGLGSALTSMSRPVESLYPLLGTVPVILVSAVPYVSLLIIGVIVLTTAVIYRWANQTFGGISGDIFGASNEIARVTGLQVGILLVSAGV